MLDIAALKDRIENINLIKANKPPPNHLAITITETNSWRPHTWFMFIVEAANNGSWIKLYQEFVVTGRLWLLLLFVEIVSYYFHGIMVTFKYPYIFTDPDPRTSYIKVRFKRLIMLIM